MIPTIFQIGPLPINSFGLAIALAVIAAIYRLSLSFEVVGLEARFAETFVFTGTIVGLIGARLWYLAEHYSEIRSDFWGAAFSSAGFTF